MVIAPSVFTWWSVGLSTGDEGIIFLNDIKHAEPIDPMPRSNLMLSHHLSYNFFLTAGCSANSITEMGNELQLHRVYLDETSESVEGGFDVRRSIS